MIIKLATPEEYEDVLRIVHETIKAIYPNYYPSEVVDFFMTHHNEQDIRKDIEKGLVYLLKEGNKYVGTGSIDGRYIGRVYILNEYQGKGYGTDIMKTLEDIIAKEYPTAYLDSSLPSYNFYLKMGYKPIEYQQYEVENKRVLCYYVMEKELGKNQD